MTNKELFNLMTDMDELKNLLGVKFSYAIIYNKKRIKEIYGIYTEMIEISPEFKQYDLNRIKLCEFHAEKDEHNKPVVVNQEYLITVNRDKFKEDLEKLNLDNIAIIEHRTKQLNIADDFLRSESKIDLIKFKHDEIPENISVRQMEIIMDLIEN